MTLASIDWLIVVVYFALSLGVGLMFTKRASRSTENYFLAGRTVPWWLAGISIVATTFASDTPLLVAGITARGGIAGNWIWWAFVLSGMLTVFFFAKLWRRSGVMTDVEFVAIRYSGRPAHFLRIFRSVYLGLPINAIIGGAVTLGMVKVLKATVGIMAGSVALAIFAVSAVGGLDGMHAGLVRTHGEAATQSLLTFFPQNDGAFLPLITLAVFLAVQWWAAAPWNSSTRCARRRGRCSSRGISTP
ncbi:MAG: hypothetical protein C0497_09870 [Gemmatimonas sp.]|nr:hypothetical protein [Gemmatimonas sp.]